MVGFTFPDGGPTPSSVFQGFTLMVVFAAPAAGTLFVPRHALGLGGAMLVAGAALLPGGNLLGLLMVVPGVLLLLAGFKSRAAVEAPEWIRLIGTAVALVVAVYLALGGGVVTGSIALVLALVIMMVSSRGEPVSDLDGQR